MNLKPLYWDIYYFRTITSCQLIIIQINNQKKQDRETESERSRERECKRDRLRDRHAERQRDGERERERPLMLLHENNLQFLGRVTLQPSTGQFASASHSNSERRGEERRDG